MPAEDSRLMVQKDVDVTVVQFLDHNILDEANIQQIGEELAGIVDKAAGPKLLLDFHNVAHLSSAALGTLITVNNKIRQKDGQLRLANIHPQIREVFSITKLDKLFQIHSTAPKALASFK